MKPQTGNNAYLSAGKHLMENYRTADSIATKLQDERRLLSTCMRMRKPRKPTSGDYKMEGKRPKGDPAFCDIQDRTPCDWWSQVLVVIYFLGQCWVNRSYLSFWVVHIVGLLRQEQQVSCWLAHGSEASTYLCLPVSHLQNSHIRKSWGPCMCTAIEQALKAKAAAAQIHIGKEGCGWWWKWTLGPAFFKPYCSCFGLSKHFLRVVSITSRQLPSYLQCTLLLNSGAYLYSTNHCSTPSAHTEFRLPV